MNSRRITCSFLVLAIITSLHPIPIVKALPVLPVDDAWHPIESDEYGEMWFFDAQFQNGCWFFGSVSVYGNITHDAVVQVNFFVSISSNNSVFVSQIYEIEEFQASVVKCDLSVGDNQITGEWPNYSLLMTNGTVTLHLNYTAEVQGWKPNAIDRFEEIGWSWVIPVPRAHVNGWIEINEEILTVEGEGYHDHILKTKSVQALYGWYWGRFFCDEITIVWSQIMLGRQQPLISFLMVAFEQNIAGESIILELSPKQYSYDNSTHAFLPTAFELSGKARTRLLQPVRLKLKVRLEKNGILISTDGNFFKNDCLIYRLKVRVRGTLWVGFMPKRIESVDLMEFVRFR